MKTVGVKGLTIATQYRSRETVLASWLNGSP